MNQPGLFDPQTICKACHRVWVVDECYPCYKARLEDEKEEATALLRAAEADCPTHKRPVCRECKSDREPVFYDTVGMFLCPACGVIASLTLDTPATNPVER